MQLIFDTLHQFHEMARALGYIKPDTISIDVPAATLEALARKAESEPAAIEYNTDSPEIQTNHVSLNSPTTDSTEPTKRKRRTKAEIEADKAAEAADKAAQTVLAVVKKTNDAALADAHKSNPLDNLKPETEVHATGHNDIARGEIAEMAGLFDGNDKLAHLNEGRAFIEKYTFAVYNETLMLAGVPANIAAHTPEQVSRHRAAMAWLAAQKAG